MLRNFSGALVAVPRVIRGNPPISRRWSFLTELTQSRSRSFRAEPSPELNSRPRFLAVTRSRTLSSDFLWFSISAPFYLYFDVRNDGKTCAGAHWGEDRRHGAKVRVCPNSMATLDEQLSLVPPSPFSFSLFCVPNAE